MKNVDWAALNPFNYRAAQIAKALVALLTSTLGFLGLAAAVFTEGPLVVFGQWAIAAALFLTPILVFIKRAEPLFGMLDNLRGDRPVD